LIFLVVVVDLVAEVVGMPPQELAEPEIPLTHHQAKVTMEELVLLPHPTMAVEVVVVLI
jgi:hypothetical protein